MARSSAIVIAQLVVLAAVPSVTVASPKRPAHVTRALPSAAGVVVSLDPPRGAGRRVALVCFPRNRVALVRTRHGALALRIGSDTALTPVIARARARVHVRLDVDASRITASAGARRVRVTRRLESEPTVIVARTLRHLRLLPIRRSVLAPVSSAAPAGHAPAPAGPVTPAQAAPMATETAELFAPDSVWKLPLSDDAALDPDNELLVRRVRNLVARNIADAVGPRISTSTTTPLYTVPADQPTVRVQLDSGSWGATLQQAFEAVPIRSTAMPAAGLDRHLTIWQPSTDRLWEFFHAEKLSDGWHADWGGAIATTSRSPGYYTTDSWPGLSKPYWGATATRLPVAAGTMMIHELSSGVIPHALAVNLPQARADVYSFPAQRTDGLSSDLDAVPEGARFRLDPELDVSALNLPPVTRAMAVAVQRYGMIVRDQTSTALNFFAENPGQYPANPYIGTTRLFGGVWSGRLLRSFPWEHLQLVRMDLRGRDDRSIG